MADACNAVQRNLYPKRDGTRFIKDYRNGDGRAYGDYMRQVSWPIPTDVPPIGQASAPLLIPELKEVHNFRDGQHYLHPTKYGKLRHTDHLSFSKTMGNLGVGMLVSHSLKPGLGLSDAAISSTKASRCGIHERHRWQFCRHTQVPSLQALRTSRSARGPCP